MNFIKTIFLIGLFNLFLITGIVVATKHSSESEVVVPLVTKEMEIEATPTAIKIIKKVLVRVDPFAVLIKNNTTQAPAKQTNSNPVPTTPPKTVLQPTADNRCIIVIDGSKYDVTVFRNQHSGGNVLIVGATCQRFFTINTQTQC